MLQFKKSWLFYIIGAIVALIVWGYSVVSFFLLLGGVGLGILMQPWVKGIIEDMTNAFFTNEQHKREMKKRELEAELERLKETEK